ncbi:MAG TPA: APC family permease [Steroidobacteraceae bacterium]|nr:APC family permease [Steroidobacteraceae bacterium]
MGLDGIASSAYGPEAALTVLIPLGAVSATYIGWVMGPILLLLAVLFASYWQTIRAYPNSGGSYIVARENLGENASLLAAAALMIDYVLNVAVAISAGVAALVSAAPALHPYMLSLALAILAFVTLVNLRGTLDAGRLFAIPTYAFVASFTAILVVGVYRAVTSGGHPHPVVPPPPLGPAVEVAALWLLLRAFAAGCTAMTGVEAVSNGVSAFREPTVKHAHRTLAGIVIILGVLLAGIGYLTRAYGIGAMDQTQPTYRSVLSQLASAVVGTGPWYYIAVGSLLCVLVLSANTSFVDFPRLCRNIAQHGFLPRPFAIAGRRLVFSIGILYLAVTAGALLIVFGGITDHLIPLFAIGAFMTFTLSQSGMVVHWLRELRQERSSTPQRAIRTHLAINAAGALTTGTALAIIVAAKFTEGAWITLAVVPAVIILLRSIRRYYDRLGARVRDTSPLHITSAAPPIVLVAIDEWNQLSDKAVTFALNLSPDVIGVHLTQLEGPYSNEEQRKIEEQWHCRVREPARKAGHPPPDLAVLPARYRAIHEPVLDFVHGLEERFRDRTIAVLIPELVKQRWYQRLLHTDRARHLRSQLLKHGGTHLTIINVPWYLDESRM